MTPGFDNYTARRFTNRGILAALSTRSVCRLAVSRREYIIGVNSISVTTRPRLRPTQRHRRPTCGFSATRRFRTPTIITIFVLLQRRPFFVRTDCGVLYRLIKTNTFRSCAPTPEALAQGFASFSAIISYFIAEYRRKYTAYFFLNCWHLFYSTNIRDTNTRPGPYNRSYRILSFSVGHRGFASPSAYRFGRIMRAI